MSSSVPLTTLNVPDEDVRAVLDCLESGWLTMGPRIQALEAALAERLGVGHVVTVSSGTAALHLTCLAVGLGPGDEMIVPGLTFVASANAARYCGAEPVLCEIAGPHDMNIDVDDVRARIGERTKAVMAVHFCGYPAEVEALRALCDERGLTLIEDCSEAITAVVGGGQPAGTVGHAGCLSFSSRSQLCVGEGGAVITDDEAIAAEVRSLRSHAMTSVTWDRHRGHAESYDIVDIGFNYRMDEPRAALGLSRLPRLDADIEARRQVARAYRQGLGQVPGIELAWSDEQVERSAHFAFPVLLPDDDRARRVPREARGGGGGKHLVSAAVRLLHLPRGLPRPLPAAGGGGRLPSLRTPDLGGHERHGRGDGDRGGRPRRVSLAHSAR